MTDTAEVTKLVEASKPGAVSRPALPMGPKRVRVTFGGAHTYDLHLRDHDGDTEIDTVCEVDIAFKAGEGFRASLVSYRMRPGWTPDAALGDGSLDVRHVALPVTLERRTYRVARLEAVLELDEETPVECTQAMPMRGRYFVDIEDPAS